MPNTKYRVSTTAVNIPKYYCVTSLTEQSWTGWSHREVLLATKTEPGEPGGSPGIICWRKDFVLRLGPCGELLLAVIPTTLGQCQKGRIKFIINCRDDIPQINKGIFMIVEFKQMEKENPNFNVTWKKRSVRGPVALAGRCGGEMIFSFWGRNPKALKKSWGAWAALKRLEFFAYFLFQWQKVRIKFIMNSHELVGLIARYYSRQRPN